MRNRVTQKHIAKAANVSVNTVSLALNGSKRISEDTRTAIIRTAEEMNYIPNQIARSLVKRRSQMVGVLLTELRNPIFMEIAQQIERNLFALGFSMILMTTDKNPESEAKSIDFLISHQVDGILMFPALNYNFEKIRKIRNTGIPIIFLSAGEHDTPTDAVFVNRIKGAYKATLHLARLGHRRIAFILDGMTPNGEKLLGYKLALQEMDIPFDPELVVTTRQVGYRQGYDAAGYLVNLHQPTAILGSRDSVALGALRWCRQQGMRVPEDMAIVGYDGVEFSQYAEVPLTTVLYNVEEVARCSVNLMFQLLDSRNLMSSLTPVKMEIEPELAIRESCGMSKRKGNTKP
ncbi:LacI family DNA-binding transcriptional regulator [Paenibacillus piri]|uniref:LacI family transcriptional regulator n=1 Tax=Paenibacillus piri TaxID=2547395 RepID=A0A4R5KDI8_9BACL|nr:LacI family DNA-binding transcriptional regulator [Paenibacillus piri]TDF93266.1 LacI family transcriptional regulator [Paenibacillus piri]